MRHRIFRQVLPLFLLVSILLADSLPAQTNQTSETDRHAEMTRLLGSLKHTDAVIPRIGFTPGNEIQVTEAFRARGIEGTRFLVHTLTQSENTNFYFGYALKILPRLKPDPSELSQELKTAFHRMQLELKSAKSGNDAEEIADRFHSFQSAILYVGTTDPEMVTLLLDDASENQKTNTIYYFPVNDSMAPAVNASLPKLAAALRHQSVTVRSMAAYLLLAAAPESTTASQMLVPLLADPNKSLRHLVAFYLHRLSGPEEALVPAMIQYRIEAENMWRYQAAIDVDDLISDLAARYPSAIPQLFDALSKARSSETRVALLRSIGKVGPAASAYTDVLRQHAQSEDNFTRVCAWQALRHITGEPQWEELVRKEWHNWSAKKNDNKWPLSAASPGPNTPSENLARFKDPNPKIRTQIARHFEMNPAEGGSRVYPLLRKLLKDPEPTVREAARKAIESIDRAHH